MVRQSFQQPTFQNYTWNKHDSDRAAEQSLVIVMIIIVIIVSRAALRKQQTNDGRRQDESASAAMEEAHFIIIIIIIVLLYYCIITITITTITIIIIFVLLFSLLIFFFFFFYIIIVIIIIVIGPLPRPPSGHVVPRRVWQGPATNNTLDTTTTTYKTMNMYICIVMCVSVYVSGKDLATFMPPPDKEITIINNDMDTK